MKLDPKKLVSDSIWSIAGLVMMNVAAQFAVYPIWNRYLGSEKYGDVLYLLSLMNIFSISVGGACNYARVTKSKMRDITSSIFLCILGVASVVAIPLTLVFRGISDVQMGTAEWALYGLLIVATMWRFYADVEYRINLNYKGYFAYYLSITLGYGLGVVLFIRTGLWPLALLPGEIFGLLRVLLKGKALRWDRKTDGSAARIVIKAALLLICAEVVSSIIFNGDRLILKMFMDGEMVTRYYLASLLGKTMSLLTTPLNSVIVGYLVRLDIKPNKRFMGILTAVLLAAALLAAFACTVGSYILIPFLYPGEFQDVKAYFLIANGAQTAYFAASVMSVVTMTFGSSQNPLRINMAYAVAFVVLCIPAAIFGGFDVFCVAMLVTGLVRLAAGAIIGYKITERQKENVDD